MPPVLTQIPGVRHREVHARGVRFHVAEAGSGDPVVLLHGWPQHWLLWRSLLADPPPGLRLIAPDLPGYGWSGPPPHAWAKEEVASDVLALLDALELEQRVLLVGHDWGGWIAFLMALRQPERFRGLLALNIAHPWNTWRSVIPGGLRLLAYQPPLAAFGVTLHRRTSFVPWLLKLGGAGLSPAQAEAYAAPFRGRDTARAARDTYRTFLLSDLPASFARPERRRLEVPVRMLFGVDDRAVHPSLAAAETAIATDYEVTLVPGCGHFIVDERPELVRAGLEAIAAETA